MRLTWILGIVVLLAASLPLAAQPAPGSARRAPQEGRYVPFPFEQDAEALVKAEFDTLKKLEPYRELVEKLLRDPAKFKVDPKLIKQLNLDDPRVRDKLKPWLDKDSQGKLVVSASDRKKLQEEVQQLAITQAPPGPAPAPAALDSTPLTTPTADDPDETARDWLKDAMNRMEQSRVGAWLRDSPAWQNVLGDLARETRLPRAPNAVGLERLTRGWLKLDRLPMPDGRLLERLNQVHLPALPSWRPSLPALGRPSLPNVTAPRLPTAANLETLALWLVGLALVALVLWRAFNVGAARRGQTPTASELGPWPVAPQAVATRADLVQAFDYLAVRCFGTSARTAHHHALARQLGQRFTALAETAASLARLYEHARYTPGDDALRNSERDQARRALTLLAEAATP